MLANATQFLHRGQRSHLVELHLADLVEQRMLFDDEQGKLSLIRFALSSGHARTSLFVNVIIFQRSKNDGCSINHVAGNTRQTRDVNPVTLVCRTFDDAVKKDDAVVFLVNGNVPVRGMLQRGR